MGVSFLHVCRRQRSATPPRSPIVMLSCLLTHKTHTSEAYGQGSTRRRGCDGRLGGRRDRGRRRVFPALGLVEGAGHGYTVQAAQPRPVPSGEMRGRWPDRANDEESIDVAIRWYCWHRGIGSACWLGCRCARVSACCHAFQNR